MKAPIVILGLVAGAMVVVFSCTKEQSCESCLPTGPDSLPAAAANQPPIARAGMDQHLSLPQDTALLDGSASTDADGKITTYKWTKIDGPASAVLVRGDSAKTPVRSLVAGVYRFVLTVTDDKGARASDTLQLRVDEATVNTNACDIGARPLVNARLAALGQLSQTRAEVATAAAAGKIVFAGGYLPGGGPSSRVDIYDVAANSWSTAELSQARYNMATAVLGNRIFFAGGDLAEPGRSPSSQVDIYDAAANRWTIAHLSEARTCMVGATAGTKVVFAGGGRRASGPSGNSSRVDIYDAADNSWSTHTLLYPQMDGSFGMVATVVGTKVYLAGGAGDWYAANTGGIYSSAINIYDAATGEWTIDNLGENGNDVSERGAMAGIAWGDKVLWAGGRTWQFVLDRKSTSLVEIRDLNTETHVFDCLFQPNPQPTAVESGARVVIFTTHTIQDGWLPPGVVTNRFDIYEPATNRWSIGVLPVNIYNASLVSANNTIYVAGGVVNGRLSGQVWTLAF